jgi:adenine/guanine phosphoribosyltransferase-like PRPP-binding protein
LATTGLLQEVLSLCTPSGLPFAIALDFYKEDDGYGRLRYTDVGRDVAVLKGYVGSTAESWKAAGTRVSDRMAEVIEGHALMSAPDFIVPVPSSRSGVSEKLGVAVAGRIGAPLLGGVEDTSGAGPAKDNPRVPRTYDVPHDLTGARVVIIDDLVSTGSTLRDLTQALGSRGAVEISSLACVRIMRNV